MKTNVIFGLLVFITMTIMGQTSKIEVTVNEKIVGKDAKSQKEIIAQEHIFPKRIHDIHVDTLSGYITLKLRKLSKNGKVLDISGVVLVYDPNTKSIKWDKKMEFTSTDVQPYQNFMTQTSGNKLTALNIENGEKLWSIKNDLYYIDQKQNKGIGYKFQGITGNLHTLQGINLSTGESLWEKELNRTYGWNKIMSLNDSTLLIVASGLHSININTGYGWNYNAVTGKKDYTETIAKNTIGTAIGVLTGTYVISTGSNLVRDVVSNVLRDSSALYIASKEKISKINQNDGQSLWSYELPEDLTSKSIIVLKDSSLCMVNTGYAYLGGKKIDFGTPFILGLDTKTGDLRFNTIISEKKDPIGNFIVEKDVIYITFKNRIEAYSLYSGTKLSSKTFNIKEFGELSSFVGDRLYTKVKDNEFIPLQLLDTTSYYVHTSKSEIMVLDKHFNITDTIDYGTLYYHYGQLNGYKLLARDGQTILLDKHHKVRATLNVTYHSIVKENILYNYNDKSLLVIDLSTLLDQDYNSVDF